MKNPYEIQFVPTGAAKMTGMIINIYRIKQLLYITSFMVALPFVYNTAFQDADERACQCFHNYNLYRLGKTLIRRISDHHTIDDVDDSDIRMAIEFRIGPMLDPYTTPAEGQSIIDANLDNQETQLMNLINDINFEALAKLMDDYDLISGPLVVSTRAEVNQIVDRVKECRDQWAMKRVHHIIDELVDEVYHRTLNMFDISRLVDDTWSGEHMSELETAYKTKDAYLNAVYRELHMGVDQRPYEDSRSAEGFEPE